MNVFLNLFIRTYIRIKESAVNVVLSIIAVSLLPVSCDHPPVEGTPIEKGGSTKQDLGTSVLGVLFRIFNEHPYPFYMEVTQGPGGVGGTPRKIG